jgi:hypothetical protein
VSELERVESSCQTHNPESSHFETQTDAIMSVDICVNTLCSVSGELVMSGTMTDSPLHLSTFSQTGSLDYTQVGGVSTQTLMDVSEKELQTENLKLACSATQTLINVSEKELQTENQELTCMATQTTIKVSEQSLQTESQDFPTISTQTSEPTVVDAFSEIDAHLLQTWTKSIQTVTPLFTDSFSQMDPAPVCTAIETQTSTPNYTNSFTQNEIPLSTCTSSQTPQPQLSNSSTVVFANFPSTIHTTHEAMSQTPLPAPMLSRGTQYSTSTISASPLASCEAQTQTDLLADRIQESGELRQQVTELVNELDELTGFGMWFFYAG